MHFNVYDVFYSPFSHQHVTATQLSTFELSYSCNNFTLNMAGIPAETCWWEHCE